MAHETFETTKATDAAFPSASDGVVSAAYAMVYDFINCGQSPREAASIVTHMLIRVGWIVAGSAAVSEGSAPDKDRFRAAVESALDDLTFTAASKHSRLN